MPQPLAICIEDVLETRSEARYLRCVALPGRQPGLRLGGGGEVLWRSEDTLACELWVSGDSQLILFRRAGAGPVIVTREGRSLAVPEEKPVVLLDLDEIGVAGRRLRVHVHGAAATVAAPEPLAALVAPASRRGLLARAAAVALAVGAAVGSSACRKRIEVRDQPPAVSREPQPEPKKVEVRDSPPAVPVRKDAPVAKPKVDSPPKK
jgi:hypothetical protein